MYRYIVEAKDEFGWFDYDSFDNVDAAIACAKLLDKTAKVIDRDEQAIIWEAS